MRNMGYIPVSRQKVRCLLRSSGGKIPEAELCKLSGMSFATYWRRFRESRWREENTRSLLIVLAQLIGRPVRMEDILDV